MHSDRQDGDILNKMNSRFSQSDPLEESMDQSDAKSPFTDFRRFTVILPALIFLFWTIYRMYLLVDFNSDIAVRTQAQSFISDWQDIRTTLYFIYTAAVIWVGYRTLTREVLSRQTKDQVFHVGFWLSDRKNRPADTLSVVVWSIILVTFSFGIADFLLTIYQTVILQTQ